MLRSKLHATIVEAIILPVAHGAREVLTYDYCIRMSCPTASDTSYYRFPKLIYPTAPLIATSEALAPCLAPRLSWDLQSASHDQRNLTRGAFQKTMGEILPYPSAFKLSSTSDQAFFRAKQYLKGERKTLLEATSLPDSSIMNIGTLSEPLASAQRSIQKHDHFLPCPSCSCSLRPSKT